MERGSQEINAQALKIAFMIIVPRRNINSRSTSNLALRTRTIY
jgi:hypothetical protein